MTDWLADEQRTERRRASGWYRTDPADIDIYKHEPTHEDRRVEKPLEEA